MSDFTGSEVAGDPPVTRRPPMVWVLSALVVVFSLLGLLGGLLLLAKVSDNGSHGQSTSAAVSVLAVVSIACSVAQAGGAVLLFLGRNLGRFLVIGVSGLVIASNLIGVLSGAGVQGCLGVVVNGAVIAAMFRPDVRDWCQR